MTGATGFLGQRVVAHLGRLGIPTDTTRVELTDPAAVRGFLADRRPGAVIHTAAVNPGGPVGRMDAVNRLGARWLARHVEGRLVAVSTDVVHDGTGAPYDDGAPPRPPPDPYPRSKAAAEAEILSVRGDAAVVRTSLLWDPGRPDRATAAMARRLLRGEAVDLFTDVLRQPAPVDDVAAALVVLATEAVDVTGTINVAGPEVVTRAGHHLRLLRWFGIPTDGTRSVAAARVAPTTPRDLRLSLGTADRLGLRIRTFAEVTGA